MMIFHMCKRIGTLATQGAPVDKLMAGRGVPAHELHGHPVFLPGLALKVEPRQVLHIVWQARAARGSHVAVI